jgi:hypothetical protein
MGSTGLSGPYRLAFDDITSVIRDKSPGAFALGYLDRDGNFLIRYVGRSDDDIRERLRSLIGSDQYFKYSYYVSSAGAFQKECELFHEFSPSGNRIHPERPAGTSLECPRCYLGYPRKKRN